MRKLKLQVQMTIDGFISGPNGEWDWMQDNWDDAFKSLSTTSQLQLTPSLWAEKR